MENRKFDRNEKQINVRIYQSGTFVALATTRDITVGGMFINIDVLLFPKNSRIDVVFDSPEADSSLQTRYAATVVHRCLKGMGIKLSGSKAANEIIFREKLSVAI